MSKEVDDQEEMETGIDQILGYVPYDIVASTPVCEHEDDGEIYGETRLNIILRCSKCNEFFEQKK